MAHRSMDILPEFDREMGTTRRLLERVPFDDPEWTAASANR